MAVVRSGQMPLEFVASTCFVCCFLTLEAMSGKWSVPLWSRTGALCGVHQARMGEGACLFCGRRLAWLHMAWEPELAICRPCFAQRRGEAAAEAVDAIQNGDAIGLIV